MLPENTEPTNGPTGAEDPDFPESTDPGENALGDAGKQALDRLKARAKEERKARLAVERELTALKNQGAGAESADATKAAIAEAVAAVQVKAAARVARASVKAAATGKLADPDDALAFIDITSLGGEKDGEIEPADIEDAISDLLKRKPHLAAQGGRTPLPDPAQGPRSGKARLSTADLFAQALDGKL